jgi:serine/threonine protein kinase
MNVALYKRKLSSSGIELIKRLLATDPLKRISAEEALNHKWLQQFKIENFQRLDSSATDQVLKNLSNFSVSMFWF